MLKVREPEGYQRVECIDAAVLIAADGDSCQHLSVNGAKLINSLVMQTFEDETRLNQYTIKPLCNSQTNDDSNNKGTGLMNPLFRVHLDKGSLCNCRTRPEASVCGTTQRTPPKQRV